MRILLALIQYLIFLFFIVNLSIGNKFTTFLTTFVGVTISELDSLSNLFITIFARSIGNNVLSLINEFIFWIL